jgi:hypothetical protein
MYGQDCNADPPFKDLNSAPWAHNPQLLYSALMRLDRNEDRENNWKRICTDKEVKTLRKQNKFPPIKLDKREAVQLRRRKKKVKQIKIKDDEKHWEEVEGDSE